MYRYNHMNRMQVHTQAPRAVERFKSIVILLLIAATAFLAIRGVPAMQYRTESQSTFVHRIQVECNNAYSLSTSLSRTAGATTTDTLARIRASIYSMETINTLSVGLQGASGWIINNEWFTTLYNILDDYNNKMVTGVSTADLATSLQNNLRTLADQLDALE